MTKGFEHDVGEDKRRPDHDVGKDKGSNSGEYRRIQEIRDLIRASIGEGSGRVLGNDRIQVRC